MEHSQPSLHSNSDRQEIAIILNLMAKFFLNPADENDFTVLCDNPIDINWGSQISWDRFYTSALDVMKDSRSNLALLEDDYLQLFVGCGMPTAPPWGSVYLHEEHLLKQKSTQDLMLFLRDNAVYFTQSENKSADHVGYCLQALSLLLQRSDHTETVNLMLGNHILPWIGRFIELSKEHAQTSFYLHLTSLLGDILKQLAQVYQVRVKPVKLYY